MNDTPQIDITYLLSVFYKRKGVIIACFLVVSSLSAILAVSLPNIYLSSTLILITPQRLPTSYINSTVTMSIEERIYSITKEILSRSRLENIINEFNLYPPTGQKNLVEGQIIKLRKKIRIETQQRENSFQLSFESKIPETAQKVTARLASLFIEKNLQIREQRAMGTTAFIKAEVKRLRKDLEGQEAVVSQYNAKHRNELPAQLDTNLRMLAQLRIELQGNLTRMSLMQGHKASLQKDIATEERNEERRAEEAEIDKDWDPMGAPILPQEKQTEHLKAKLDALLIRYSERHPDVIHLKQEIKVVESEASFHEPKTEKLAPTKNLEIINPLRQMFQRQIENSNKDIKSLRSNKEVIRKKIGLYQKRIDETPVRAIELSKISRTYNITLRKYQDLLGKLLDSELSENMEKKQKAEQFQVIDPANLPHEPVRPNRKRILLLGLIGGLAVGFGLVFLWENMNTSFKRGDDVEGYTDVPLLATIPAFTTRRSVLEHRRALVILVLASAGMLAIGIVFIGFLVPPFFPG